MQGAQPAKRHVYLLHEQQQPGSPSGLCSGGHTPIAMTLSHSRLSPSSALADLISV